MTLRLQESPSFIAGEEGISGFWLFLLEIIPDDPSDDISTAPTFFSCYLVDLCKIFVVDSDRTMFFHRASIRILNGLSWDDVIVSGRDF